MKKLIALLMIVSLALTGCSNSSSDKELTVYNDYELQTAEIENVNYLTTNQSATIRVVANFVDALLEYNPKGELVGCLAEKWEANEDASVWTFTLRDDLKWVNNKGEEYADVTAADFVAGVKYILTDSNGSRNVNNITSFLTGATEYSEASKNGVATDALFDAVGVKAIDEKTVQYTLVSPKPYFDSVVTYISWFPVNQAFLDEIGVENFGTEPDTILYNGCYLLTEYENGARKTYTKNASYWDIKNIPFETVNITMIESLNRAYDMYQTGELDRAVLTQDTIKVLGDSENLVETRVGARSGQIYFNYEQKDNDNWNTAVANLNFRKAWLYGLDPIDYLSRSNPNTPEVLKNNLYTAGIVVKDSSGKYYKDFEELSDYVDGNYDVEKFAVAKAAAMEELTAAGVTFPVRVTLPYASGNQTAEETFAVLKASIEKNLGTDFVQVEGIPYVKSATSEIYNHNLQSIGLSGWAPDYNDPYDFLRHMTDSSDGYMNNLLSHMSDSKFDELVYKANEIVDLDERYHAFAEAEVYYLENAYSIPFYTDGNEIQVTKINDYSKPYSFTSVGKKIKFWETNAEGYTKADYEKFAKES